MEKEAFETILKKHFSLNEQQDINNLAENLFGLSSAKSPSINDVYEEIFKAMEFHKYEFISIKKALRARIERLYYIRKQIHNFDNEAELLPAFMSCEIKIENAILKYYPCWDKEKQEKVSFDLADSLYPWIGRKETFPKIIDLLKDEIQFRKMTKAFSTKASEIVIQIKGEGDAKEVTFISETFIQSFMHEFTRHFENGNMLIKDKSADELRNQLIEYQKTDKNFYHTIAQIIALYFCKKDLLDISEIDETRKIDVWRKKYMNKSGIPYKFDATFLFFIAEIINALYDYNIFLKHCKIEQVDNIDYRNNDKAIKRSNALRHVESLTAEETKKYVQSAKLKSEITQFFKTKDTDIELASTPSSYEKYHGFLL